MTETATETKSKQALEDELYADLELFMVLQVQASKFKKLKEKLKPVFEGTKTFTIRDITVTGDYVSQPEKRMRACTYWDMRVKKIPVHTLTIGEGAKDGV